MSGFKIFLVAFFSLLSFLFIFSLSTTAQMMSSSVLKDNVSQTKKEEEKGQKIYNDLRNGKTNCKSLKDDDFEKLGEFFMGQSVGDTQRHYIMNQMMVSMMGENGEEQMHIAMGKRLSGCDLNASIPQKGNNFFSMFSNWKGGGNAMMWYGPAFGTGPIFMLLFSVLIIVAIIVLIKYLGFSGRETEHSSGKRALDILQERYAKGEIDKKEYEEKKKDLTEK